VNGWDYNRLLQLLAVLEKRIGLSLSRLDVYVNIVGGLDFEDPGGDLGIAFAVATSFLDRSIDPGLVAVGEVGLTGEIRPVQNLGPRLKEAQRLGFNKAIVPKVNLPLQSPPGKMEIIGVDTLADALRAAIPGLELGAGSRKRSDQPLQSEAEARSGGSKVLPD
jgi:DNA repair protein RadA/Sms